MRESFVYIMSNQSRRLYTGVTSNLEQRVLQHRKKLIAGFTKRYNLTQLAWYESFTDIEQAFEAEKRIKGWKRDKKLALIEAANPHWEDLAQDWYPTDSH